MKREYLKSVIILILFFTPFATLFAQNESAFGGYFGLNSHYTQINGQDALLLGAEITAVINHGFNIFPECLIITGKAPLPDEIQGVINTPWKTLDQACKLCSCFFVVLCDG